MHWQASDEQHDGSARGLDGHGGLDMALSSRGSRAEIANAIRQGLGSHNRTALCVELAAAIGPRMQPRAYQIFEAHVQGRQPC